MNSLQYSIMGNYTLLLNKLSITLLLVSCFVSRGARGESCDLNSITIGTVRSGREIQGKPEWNVQVVSTCKSCALTNIELSCQGFQTVEAIDPSIFQFQKDGDRCLVNGGRPLQPQASVRFSYAWDPPFLLRPFSALVMC